MNGIILCLAFELLRLHVKPHKRIAGFYKNTGDFLDQQLLKKPQAAGYLVTKNASWGSAPKPRMAREPKVLASSPPQAAGVPIGVLATALPP
jgi:hypothetical protein